MTDITLYKFTNNQESPYLDSQLAMFYSGAFRNTIGIMEARRELENGEVVPVLLLVGVEQEDGKFHCFPLAEILSSETAATYLHPDGEGGYKRPEKEECPAT